MMITLRSFVLVLLVAMASAMPAAAMHDKSMDSRLEKLEKKIAALVATKTASSKQVRRAPQREACACERTPGPAATLCIRTPQAAHLAAPRLALWRLSH